jgi:DNA-binding PadR family transcriptional regulator
MNHFRVHLLRLIQSKDRQLSWYQIDRALSSAGVEREEHLMQSLKGLESDGYVVTHVGANPSQPTYAITSAGATILTNIPNVQRGA